MVVDGKYMFIPRFSWERKKMEDHINLFIMFSCCLYDAMCRIHLCHY